MLDHAAITRLESYDRRADVGESLIAPRIGILELLGGALGAYHGYKRNDDSFGWGLGWGLLGLNFPILTVAAAGYEGFGKSAPNAGLLQPAPKAT